MESHGIIETCSSQGAHLFSEAGLRLSGADPTGAPRNDSTGCRCSTMIFLGVKTTKNASNHIYIVLYCVYIIYIIVFSFRCV